MKSLLPKPSEKLFLPKPAYVTSKRAKNLFLLGLFVSWIIMPELLWHKLGLIAHYFAVLVHFLYETLSFLLEESLMHSFDMEKYYAQMLVFYLFFTLGCLIIYWLFKRLPQFLQSVKNKIIQFCSHVKYQTILTWHCLTIWQKVKLLLLQLIGLAGGLMILIS